MVLHLGKAMCWGRWCACAAKRKQAHVLLTAGSSPWNGATHPHPPAGCHDAAGVDRADADAAQELQGSETLAQHSDSVDLPGEA